MTTEVAYLIELSDVYDGWSVEVLNDGTKRNRWANHDGTPCEGYERRYAATQAYIDGMGGNTDD